MIACSYMKARPFGFVKRSTSGYKRKIVTKVGGIVPEFLSAYSTYVCKDPECVTSMILPPVYEQLFIMQQMFDLTTKVDISGLEGPFMKLFMMHDTQGVEVLANALLNYQKSKAVIESVVEYTKEIPGLVIDTVEM
jgi:hypothetical protein